MYEARVNKPAHGLGGLTSMVTLASWAGVTPNASNCETRVVSGSLRAVCSIGPLALDEMTCQAIVIIDNNARDRTRLDLLCNLADGQWPLCIRLLTNVKIDHRHDRDEQQKIDNV